MVSEGMVGSLEHSHKQLQQISLMCSAVAWHGRFQRKTERSSPRCPGSGRRFGMLFPSWADAASPYFSV